MTHIKGSPTEGHRDNPKQQCIDRGGRWNEERQVCVMPATFKEKPKVFKDAPTKGQGFALPTSENPELAAQQAAARKAEDELVAKQDLAITSLADLKEEPPVQSEQPPVQSEQPLGVLAEDITRITDVGEVVIPAGTAITSSMAATLGLTTDSSELQQADFQARLIAEGAGASKGIGLVGKVYGFLSRIFKGTKVAGKVAGKVAPKAAGPGSRAAGTNPRAAGTNPRALKAKASEVLQAPGRLRKATSALKQASIFFGFGGAGFIANNLLTANVKRIEQEVSKAGEQLTKIAEAASLGFQIDDDGNVFEYTTGQALTDVRETQQALLQSQTDLKAGSIGKAFLKLTGRYNSAQLEIDKQLVEIGVAEGKILKVIANPEQALINSREFWRGLDLE